MASTPSTNTNNPPTSDDEKSHTFRKRRLSLSRHKVGADCPSDASASNDNTHTTSNSTAAAAVAAAANPGHGDDDHADDRSHPLPSAAEADEKAHTFRKRRLSLTLKTPNKEADDEEEPSPEETEEPATAKRPRRASDASAASLSTGGDDELKVRTLHAGEIVPSNSRCPPSPVPDFAATVTGGDTTTGTTTGTTTNTQQQQQTHVLYRMSRPNSMTLLQQQPQEQPKWKKRIVRKHDEDERKLPFPRDIVGTYSCHGVEPVYDSDYDPIEDLEEDEQDEWAPTPLPPTKSPFSLGEPKPTTAAKINQDRGGVAFPYGNCAKTALFAAYDGHGQGGELVSQFALHEIQSRLEKRPEFNSNLEEAFKQTFLQVDQALQEEPLIDPLYAGTTACVALLRENTLTVANAGDSRAVIARKVKDNRSGDEDVIQYQAIDLTVDQNPDLPEERKRIESMGGFVSPPPEPGLSARVWLDEGFSQIGLAMARSIGDHAVAQVGVIAEPVVTSHQVSPQDDFLIIATDGVWEFLSSEAAVEIVGANLSRGATKATQALIEAAAARWHDEEGDYRDDITALVVRLSELWKDTTSTVGSTSNGNDEDKETTSQTPQS